MASLYGAGAAIGFTPQQVDRMSIWQFAAAIDGYVRANSAGGEKLTEAQKDALFEWIDSDPIDGRTLTTPIYAWTGTALVAVRRVSFVTSH